MKKSYKNPKAKMIALDAEEYCIGIGSKDVDEGWTKKQEPVIEHTNSIWD